MGFRQSRGFTLSECTQVSTVHCSLHCHVAHIGNLLFLQLPRSLDSSGIFSLIFFSTVRSTPFESFLFRPAPAASSSEPQSRCISISSASRIDGRIQSCDKFQQSSSRLSARKLLRLDFLAVCDMRFCRNKSKKIQYLQRHRILNMVRVVWCIFFSFAKN